MQVVTTYGTSTGTTARHKWQEQQMDQNIKKQFGGHDGLITLGMSSLSCFLVASQKTRKVITGRQKKVDICGVDIMEGENSVFLRLIKGVMEVIATG